MMKASSAATTTSNDQEGNLLLSVDHGSGDGGGQSSIKDILQKEIIAILNQKKTNAPSTSKSSNVEKASSSNEDVGLSVSAVKQHCKDSLLKLESSSKTNLNDELFSSVVKDMISKGSIVNKNITGSGGGLAEEDHILCSTDGVVDDDISIEKEELEETSDSSKFLPGLVNRRQTNGSSDDRGGSDNDDDKGEDVSGFISSDEEKDDDSKSEVEDGNDDEEGDKDESGSVAGSSQGDIPSLVKRDISDDEDDGLSEGNEADIDDDDDDDGPERKDRNKGKVVVLKPDDRPSFNTGQTNENDINVEKSDDSDDDSDIPGLVDRGFSGSDDDITSVEDKGIYKYDDDSDDDSIDNSNIMGDRDNKDESSTSPASFGGFETTPRTVTTKTASSSSLPPPVPTSKGSKGDSISSNDNNPTVTTATAPTTIKAGAFMKLVGLQARSELNGDIVEIIREETTKGRWFVKRNTDGQEFSVKAENLIDLPRDERDDPESNTNNEKKHKNKRKRKTKKKRSPTTATEPTTFTSTPSVNSKNDDSNNSFSNAYSDNGNIIYSDTNDDSSLEHITGNNINNAGEDNDDPPPLLERDMPSSTTIISKKKKRNKNNIGKKHSKNDKSKDEKEESIPQLFDRKAYREHGDSVSHSCSEDNDSNSSDDDDNDDDGNNKKVSTAVPGPGNSNDNKKHEKDKATSNTSPTGGPAATKRMDNNKNAPVGSAATGKKKTETGRAAADTTRKKKSVADVETAAEAKKHADEVARAALAAKKKKAQADAVNTAAREKKKAEAAKKKLAAKRKKSAKCLQRAWRGYICRKKYQEEREKKLASLRTIQRYLRGYTVRQYVAQNNAATTIQAPARGLVEKIRYKKKLMVTTQLAALFRGYVLRTSYKRLKSATKINSIVRRFLARRLYGDQILKGYKEWKIVYDKWNPIQSFIDIESKLIVHGLATTNTEQGEKKSALFSWRNLKKTSFDISQTEDNHRLGKEEKEDKKTTERIINAAREGLDDVVLEEEQFENNIVDGDDLIKTSPESSSVPPVPEHPDEDDPTATKEESKNNAKEIGDVEESGISEVIVASRASASGMTQEEHDHRLAVTLQEKEGKEAIESEKKKEKEESGISEVIVTRRKSGNRQKVGMTQEEHDHRIALSLQEVESALQYHLHRAGTAGRSNTSSSSLGASRDSSPLHDGPSTTFEEDEASLVPSQVSSSAGTAPLDHTTATRSDTTSETTATYEGKDKVTKVDDDSKTIRQEGVTTTKATLTESNLNANAKSFVFNPNAKTFEPSTIFGGAVDSPLTSLQMQPIVNMHSNAQSRDIVHQMTYPPRPPLHGFSTVNPMMQQRLPPPPQYMMGHPGMIMNSPHHYLPQSMGHTSPFLMPPYARMGQHMVGRPAAIQQRQHAQSSATALQSTKSPSVTGINQASTASDPRRTPKTMQKLQVQVQQLRSSEPKDQSSVYPVLPVSSTSAPVVDESSAATDQLLSKTLTTASSISISNDGSIDGREKRAQMDSSEHQIDGGQSQKDKRSENPQDGFCDSSSQSNALPVISGGGGGGGDDEPLVNETSSGDDFGSENSSTKNKGEDDAEEAIEESSTNSNIEQDEDPPQNEALSEDDFDNENNDKANEGNEDDGALSEGELPTKSDKQIVEDENLTSASGTKKRRREDDEDDMIGENMTPVKSNRSHSFDTRKRRRRLSNAPDFGVENIDKEEGEVIEEKPEEEFTMTTTNDDVKLAGSTTNKVPSSKIVVSLQYDEEEFNAKVITEENASVQTSSVFNDNEIMVVTPKKESSTQERRNFQPAVVTPDNDLRTHSSVATADEDLSTYPSLVTPDEEMTTTASVIDDTTLAEIPDEKSLARLLSTSDIPVVTPDDESAAKTCESGNLIDATTPLNDISSAKQVLSGTPEPASPAVEDNVEVSSSGGNDVDVPPYQECHRLLSDRYDNILLSHAALKWFKNADPKFKGFFLRRIRQFANGEYERSYKLRKRLTGCKHIIYEAYLEQKVAHRIIFTECRSKGACSSSSSNGINVTGGDSKKVTNSILVWYVSTHDRVSRHIRQIDECEARMNRQFRASAAHLFHDNGEDDIIKSKEGNAMALDNDTILLDPFANTPLKIHQLQSSQIDKLGLEAWTPPFRLTNDEKKIVSAPGPTVLVFGRSGTGKTVCIVNRMVFDAEFHGGGNRATPLKQLFVSRSRRIKDLVQRLVEEVKRVDDDDHLERSFVSYERIIRICNSALTNLGYPTNVPAMEESKLHCDFSCFKEFFISIKKKKEMKTKKLTALVVWTQIRSYIKGSIEAVMNGRPLAEAEYLDLGKTYCRLSKEQRQEAYAVYKKYSVWLEINGYYDSCDRTVDLLNRIHRVSPEERSKNNILFDKIYVDECQDFTSSDFALFWRLCQGGGDIFLAGDTAQSVEQGIAFRFDDVKRVFYEMGKVDRAAGVQSIALPTKPLTIHINFRSHCGILEVAAAVLTMLHEAFPGAADKLQGDEGLFKGPRPSILRRKDEQFLDIEDLRDIVTKNPSLVVLTPDENTSSLKAQLGFIADGLVVLGICEAKGLDFDEVIVVDFFSTASIQLGKAWKELFKMATFSKNVDLDLRDRFPELEMKLKLLYTAITRCRHRLFFVETKQSAVGDGFSRWVLGAGLSEKQDVDDLTVQLKSADEWRSLGIEYAINAETQDTAEEAEVWFKRASMCFIQAHDEHLLNKSEAQSKFRSKAMILASDSIWEELQDEVPRLVLDCLEYGGFLDEAIDLCEMLLERCPMKEKKLNDAVDNVLVDMKAARDLM